MAEGIVAVKADDLLKDVEEKYGLESVIEYLGGKGIKVRVCLTCKEFDEGLTYLPRCGACLLERFRRKLALQTCGDWAPKEVSDN